MEQKEIGATDKAGRLVSEYEKSFVRISTTFHPAGLPGEIPGKSSNIAFAARHIANVHQVDLNEGTSNVVITVMDGMHLHLLLHSLLTTQPTHTSCKTISARFVACTTPIPPTQTTPSTPAPSFSTATPTKRPSWSAVPTCFGGLPVSRQCTWAAASPSRRPSTPCLFRSPKTSAAGTATPQPSARTCT